VLPFQLTSPAVSGTPAYIPDPDAPQERPEPAIAAGTSVYDNAGQRIGEVEAVDLDPASRRITRVVVRRGKLFRRETTIPAGVISPAAGRPDACTRAGPRRRTRPRPTATGTSLRGRAPASCDRRRAPPCTWPRSVACGSCARRTPAR